MLTSTYQLKKVTVYLYTFALFTVSDGTSSYSLQLLKLKELNVKGHATCLRPLDHHHATVLLVRFW
jgi:hypothetical protein